MPFFAGLRTLIFLVLFSASLFGNDSFSSFSDIARSSWFRERGINADDFRDFWLASPASSAEKEETLLWLLSLKRAYPQIIQQILWEKGDWLIQTYAGDELYWAGGRLLPDAERANASTYAPLFRYGVVTELYDSTKLSPELKTALLARYSAQSLSRYREMPLFWADALYGGSRERDIKHQLVSVEFLGYSLKVHPLLVKPLERAQIKINRSSGQMSTVRELRTFREKLETKGIHAFRWREIAGTPNVSYHSFAVAIDFLPKGDQRDVYWQTARDAGEDWVSRPLKERFHIPRIIQDVLEGEGFLWGGKWINWDVQHFEYRPELYYFHEIKRELGDFWNYIF